jgi:RNA polymerase sigma-70 factor (sigma-E family)
VTGSTRQSLAELYETHSSASLRLAYLLTGDAAAAEDLVHEAFVRMFARFRDRQAQPGLKAYLRVTIVNLSKDRHRKAKGLRSIVERATVSPTADATPEVDSRLVMRERLASLPHRQRAALILRYYEDLSEAEAADALGCSVPALKQLTKRGLGSMRQQGSENDDD